MQLSIKPKVFVFVSIIVFIISLTRTAFTYKDFEGIHEIPSINAFLMGGTAILGGGLFEWIVWLANPMYFISMIFFLKGNIKAKKLSLIATVLSLTFAFWMKILASESGREANITSKNSGYVLWFLSILILTLGIHYFFNAKNYGIKVHSFEEMDEKEVLI